MQSLCIMREKWKLPVWKAFFFLRGLEYFLINLSFVFQGKRVWVKMEEKPCPTEIPYQMEIFLLSRRL